MPVWQRLAFLWGNYFTTGYTIRQLLDLKYIHKTRKTTTQINTK